VHYTNHISSTTTSKILETAIHKLLTDKGKKVASHSNSSKESSKWVTSHAQQNDVQSPVFCKIQPQGSNKPLVERDKSTDKAKKSTSSEKRQTASHKKYGFWISCLINEEFNLYFDFYYWDDMLLHF